MKHLFILSELMLSGGTDAGSARMRNAARAFAAEGVKVYLCSIKMSKRIGVDTLKEIHPNIYLVGAEGNNNPSDFRKRMTMIFNIFVAANYVRQIFKLSAQMKGEKAFYVYPQPAVSLDVVSIVYGKFIKKFRIYADINEWRLGILKLRKYPRQIFIKMYRMYRFSIHFLKYHLSERLTKYYDGLVVISTNIESYFKKYNRNLLRIPILSNTSDVPFRESPSFVQGDTFSMCFTGMISKEKEGFDVLYKALSVVKRAFSSFELNLYGPVSKREKGHLLEDLPSKYGIRENIFHHGVVPHEDVVAAMQKSHLLIMARPLNSQTKYGFSTKLAEYLVSGVPVLITDVSDNALYIKDGENGFVVEPGNPDQLADKIVSIISNYARLKDVIGKNAYRTAQRCFDYSNYSKSLYAFFFPE